MTSSLGTQLTHFVALMGGGKRITPSSLDEVRKLYNWHRGRRNEHACAGIAFLAAEIFSLYYTRNNKICFVITTTVSGLASLYCLHSVYVHHRWIRGVDTCCNATLQVLTQATQAVQTTLCRVINVKFTKDTRIPNVRAIVHDTVRNFFDPKKPFFDNQGPRETLNHFFSHQYDTNLLSQKVQGEGLIEPLERIHGCLRRIRYGWEGATPNNEYHAYFYVNETQQPFQVYPIPALVFLA